jgi:hypothetical protein
MKLTLFLTTISLLVISVFAQQDDPLINSFYLEVVWKKIPEQDRDTGLIRQVCLFRFNI